MTCTCWNIHSDIEWPYYDTMPKQVMYDIRADVAVAAAVADGTSFGRIRFLDDVAVELGAHSTNLYDGF